MTGTSNINASTGAICEPDAEFCTFPDHDHRNPRQIAWQLVIDGVAAGLPIPAAVAIPGHYNIFEVRVPQNDRDGADAWAAYLGLDDPQMKEPLQGCKHDIYSTETYGFPKLPGRWKAEVTAFCDKDGAL